MRDEIQGRVFPQTCWLKKLQKRMSVNEWETDNRLSVIFMNQQMTFQTRKSCLQNIKISRYLIICFFKNKINVRHTMFVEDIQIAIFCIWVRITSNYFHKQSEKHNPLLFVSTTPKNTDHIFNNHVSQDMSKDQFKQLCKHAWSKPHKFVVIGLNSHLNTKRSFRTWICKILSEIENTGRKTKNLIWNLIK